MVTVGSKNDVDCVRTFRDLIDLRAEAQWENVFLISPETGRTLTFRRLQEQSYHLCSVLREAGLERGDKAAFMLNNGLLTAQLFLGTMYGGFVSVPLNVRAGASALSYTLDHCDARVVFVEAQFRPLIKAALVNVRRSVKVIPADVDGFVAGGAPPPAILLPAPEPEEVALLKYTSGSTGQPKAAVHSHRTLLACAENLCQVHRLTEADRSLLLLPLYHGNAQSVTLISTLLSGGSIVVPHEFSVSRFWGWLDQYRCTWSALVPTIISQLLEWKDPQVVSGQQAFKQIRFFRSSSAPLSPALHREFMERFNLLLIQAMGSSEAGDVFSNPLPPGENRIGSPGRPIGCEVRIANGDGKDVPPGEPGELLLRGPTMMQGYYKDPGETAAAFDSDGWFRSGDLAYQDAEGYCFIVGRSKELIIKGGMNIAPKQIDEVLESHPSVLEAATVGVPDQYMGEDIIAFVVLRSGRGGDSRELLKLCERYLGHFKTPIRICFVKDLPKGPSGKVQRLKLREHATRPSISESDSFEVEAALNDDSKATSDDSQGVLTPIEQMIAAIWAELLRQPQVDARANFFSLGGNSLQAIQCLSRLREKLPMALSLSDFFKSPTAAGLASLVRHRLNSNIRVAARSSSNAAIPLRNRSLPSPLSPAQEQLWFLQQLNPDVPVYNEAEAVRLRGELDVLALEQALQAIVNRHEILRTTIQVKDEEPVAIVNEDWQLKLKRIDLRQLATAQREAELEQLLIKEPQGPYRLEVEPGIRATIIQLSVEDHVFILMTHHIISDRFSLGILWRELGTAYGAFLRGEPALLPCLPIQYGDYANWQRQRMAESGVTEDLAFWKEKLRGAPNALDLPVDRPRPRMISYRGNKRQFRLERKLANELRKLCGREQISLFTLFAAAVNTLLYRYTGQDDILMGMPIADRDRPELQRLIGFLTDIHVLRTSLASNLTFRELLGRVQQGLVEVYSHRAVPFGKVVKFVNPERDPSRSPLFQVMLNWRDRDTQPQYIGLPNLRVEPLLAQCKISKFDLAFSPTDVAEEILLEIEYNTDLFDDARIEQMFDNFRTLLEAVVADPNRLLADLPLSIGTLRE